MTIRLAIPKGRLLSDVKPILDSAGLSLDENYKNCRKLIHGTNDANVEVCLVRSKDVPLLVKSGYADIGVIGSDTLLDCDDIGHIASHDLGVSCCRVSVIGKQRTSLFGRSSIVVATKYPKIAEEFFVNHNVDTTIIKMHGAVELAPILDMADVAVDIVDTGSTLLSNDLVEIHYICSISAQLITNGPKDWQNDAVKDLVERLLKEKERIEFMPSAMLPEFTDVSSQNRVLM